MNNQFATQFLREEVDQDWLKNYQRVVTEYLYILKNHEKNNL